MVLSRACFFIVLSLLPCALSQLSTADSDDSRKGWQAGALTRSSWSIVWSNLATILACTWTVFHLNTPGLEESDAVVRRRRIKWFFVAVIGPEFVIMAALEQFLIARKTVAAIAKFTAEKEAQTTTAPVEHAATPAARRARDALQPWTLAHGYLLTMGGLIVRADSGDYSVLEVEDVVRLADSGRAVFPEIKAKDIQDRNKADSFAKLFTLGQSIWFLINILGRVAYGMPVAPVEFITLGYIICSVVIYALWWSKPKDMMVPFTIKLLQPMVEIPIMTPAVTTPAVAPTVAPAAVPAAATPTPKSAVAPATAPATAPTLATAENEQQLQQQGVGTNALQPALSDYVAEISQRRSNLDDTTGDEIFVRVAGGALAVVFGGIHVGAWNFAFASPGERIAWRVCSVSSAAAPIVALLLPLILYFEEVLSSGWSKVCGALYFILFFGLIIVYCVARLALIVLACMAMRSLPSTCYETVGWVHALPHL